MKKELFHKIMADAKENDMNVIIVLDTIKSCGGYSSTNSNATVKAQEVYEFEDYFQFDITDLGFLTAHNISGTVFSEYENVKMIIVKE